MAPVDKHRPLILAITRQLDNLLTTWQLTLWVQPCHSYLSFLSQACHSLLYKVVVWFSRIQYNLITRSLLACSCDQFTTCIQPCDHTVHGCYKVVTTFTRLSQPCDFCMGMPSLNKRWLHETMRDVKNHDMVSESHKSAALVLVVSECVLGI